MTFAGQPRDHHIYDHAHESPRVMYYPLVVLAVLAIAVGWSTADSFFEPVTGRHGVQQLLEQAQPVGTHEASHGVLVEVQYPAAHDAHLPAYHVPATWAATVDGAGRLSAGGALLRPADSESKRGQLALPSDLRVLDSQVVFRRVVRRVFVQPVLFLSRCVAQFDKHVIDRLIDGLAALRARTARVDDLIDRYLVDGVVNVMAAWIYDLGDWLHGAETGKLRQYVMFIVVATVALFVLISFYLSPSLAGN